MAFTTHSGIHIKAIVNVIPANQTDNLELAIIDADQRPKLVDYTGIRYKRISNEPVKNLFKKGIEEALLATNWSINDIDVLICVTQTAELSIPSISCILHGHFNFDCNTLCYDINSGCSGYVYGLQTVASILATISKPNPKALLCCGDVSSHLLAQNDTSTQPIFSDAISVTAIEKNENNTPMYFNLETYGKGQKAIFSELDETGKEVMRLNGIDVFAYSVKHVPQNIKSLLAKWPNLHPSLFVFHQANKLINDAITKNLNLQKHQVPSSLHKYGNTASASIPITIATCNFDVETWILLSGFGVGFSVASAILKLKPSTIIKTIEI